MSKQESYSLTARIGVIVAFALMLIAALCWLAFSSYSITNQLTSGTSYIVFDKGSFYMLGICITLIALLYDFIYETAKKRPLSATATKFVNRTGIAGVAIMLTFPHVIHYSIESYITTRGYKICEEASYQWLAYRKIVFTDNIDTCNKLADEPQ